MAPEEVCRVLPTPSKGYGVFILQPITAGTVLLHDKAILRLERGSNDITPTQLHTALSALSREERTAFLSLHENNLPYKSRDLRVYKSNCFGDAATSWLSLVFARVNHSCAPNAEVTDIDAPDGARIVAIKPIAVGEEVCISYLGPGEDGRKEVRRQLLRGTYGFECDCSACSMSGRKGWLSDVRRGCVAVLAGRQMGLEVSELRRVEGVSGSSNSTAPLGYAHQPLQQPLTAREKVQTNVLLALLLEAEGLVNYRLAQAWVHAAVALMAQMQALRPLVVLPAARFLEEWLHRALQTMRSVRKEESRDVKELRDAVGVLVGCSYVVVAKKVMDEVGKTDRRAKVNGEAKIVGKRNKKARKKEDVKESKHGIVEREEVFATIFGETHQRLTQKDCVNYARKMKGRKKAAVEIVIEECDP